MKFIYFFYALFFSLLVMISVVKAQVPQAFVYQMVCRNPQGNPYLSHPLHFKVDIVKDSANGLVVFSETHRDTTSVMGVSSLDIGRSSPLVGLFNSINWGTGPYFMRISFDPNGGNNFIPVLIQSMQSVPYTLKSGNDLFDGSQPNQFLFWNGNAWALLPPGQSGQSLCICNGALVWLAGGVCATSIGSLLCSTSVHTGNLFQGVNATGVSSTIQYTGGNFGPHNGQTVLSTGVTGLTATLSPGNFIAGNGTLTYQITGMPSSFGIANFAISIGGRSCTLSRVVDSARVSSLNCGTAIHSGILLSGIVASGVSSSIPYTGGNGGYQTGQVVASTGVSGLTATLSAGNFAIGNGNLVYSITGTPTSSGTASFAINIGGQSCTLTRPVSGWRSGMVHCSGPTQIVEVVNPTTNKTWMDRNLGASQVATSSTDANAYGDLYQWGRFGDGHQCRNSGNTTTLSNSNTPVNSNYIIASATPNDWRNPQNNTLWQGETGINNPCPANFRLPTDAEWTAERNTWSSNSSSGAFGSRLKLTAAGYRGNSINGVLFTVGSEGLYWSSTVTGTNSFYLRFGYSGMVNGVRADGFSVRCIKN